MLPYLLEALLALAPAMAGLKEAQKVIVVHPDILDTYRERESQREYIDYQIFMKTWKDWSTKAVFVPAQIYRLTGYGNTNVRL